MSFFKILMGFTALNVVLQILRGNHWLEVTVALVLFGLTVFALKLWEEEE